VSGTQWGVDSGERVTDNYSGCGRTGSLAWYVRYCLYYYPAPPDNIVYWARYFVNETLSFQWTAAESAALLGANIHWVVPICETHQTNLGGSSDQGHVDATSFSWNVWNAIANNGQMHFPGSGRIDCFLDIEGSTYLSPDYWSGWATEVNSFTGNGGQGYPLYAHAYLGGGTYRNQNCTTLASFANASGIGAKCFGIWSNQPEKVGGCSGCGSPGPSWQPQNCSPLTTRLWQYGSQPTCNGCFYSPVDVDSSNPSITGPYGNDETDYMIYVN
jgi:hypothetical protein